MKIHLSDVLNSVVWNITSISVSVKNVTLAGDWNRCVAFCVPASRLTFRALRIWPPDFQAGLLPSSWRLSVPTPVGLASVCACRPPPLPAQGLSKTVDLFSWGVLQWWYFHVSWAPWLIITGSGFDDWIYWHLLFQSLLITINYSAIANLPATQITRTCYPFPGNGFIRGTITSNHCEVFLPFLVQSPWTADPPELDPILQFELSSYKETRNIDAAWTT
jgi:hypothetical protein